MKLANNKVWRIIIPIAVFVLTLGIHYILSGIFPERSAAQDSWVHVNIDWMQSYISNQNYWLGFSYGLSLAFASYAIMKFLKRRENNSGSLAVGSIGWTGFLAVAGCFLLGCCGSPMLAVYISLFGASFLSFIPFMKPLVALITVVSISVAFIWMNRRRKPEKECECAGCQTVFNSKQ